MGRDGWVGMGGWAVFLKFLRNSEFKFSHKKRGVGKIGGGFEKMGRYHLFSY